MGAPAHSLTIIENIVRSLFFPGGGKGWGSHWGPRPSHFFELGTPTPLRLVLPKDLIPAQLDYKPRTRLTSNALELQQRSCKAHGATSHEP